MVSPSLPVRTPPRQALGSASSHIALARIHPTKRVAKDTPTDRLPPFHLYHRSRSPIFLLLFPLLLLPTTSSSNILLQVVGATCRRWDHPSLSQTSPAVHQLSTITRTGWTRPSIHTSHCCLLESYIDALDREQENNTGSPSQDISLTTYGPQQLSVLVRAIFSLDCFSFLQETTIGMCLSRVLHTDFSIAAVCMLV